MKLYITTESGQVFKDGVGASGIDLSSLPYNVNTVQWNGTSGFMDFTDGSQTETLSGIDRFLGIIPLWEIAYKKEHKPAPYYVWDYKSNDWKVDTNAKKQYDIDQQVSTYKIYLNDTDWYYARKAETGQDIPLDVVSQRKTARDYIVANTL